MAEARGELEPSSDDEHVSYEGYSLLPGGPLDAGPGECGTDDDVSEFESDEDEEAARQAELAYAAQMMVMTERERMFLCEANQNAAREAAAAAAVADVWEQGAFTAVPVLGAAAAVSGATPETVPRPGGAAAASAEGAEEDQDAAGALDTSALHEALARNESVPIPAAVLCARFIGEIAVERVAPARLEAEDFELSAERITQIQSAMASIVLPGLPTPPWAGSGEDDSAWLAQLARSLQTRKK